MSDDRTDDCRIYVVGDLAADVSPGNATVVTERDDADIVVAVGEPALLDLAREGCEVPILPVDAGAGVRAVEPSSLGDALDSVCRGEPTALELPVLGVDVDGTRRARALLDVMLVTAEPAHISEFDVRTRNDHIAQFRADGFVVATAAGTSGYANRVGSPVFAPEVSAAAVVPVAPFATSLDHWVVSLPEEEALIEGEVTREEAEISLLADDRNVGLVTTGEPVVISVVDTITVWHGPESISCFQASEGSPRDSRMSPRRGNEEVETS